MRGEQGEFCARRCGCVDVGALGYGASSSQPDSQGISGGEGQEGIRYDRLMTTASPEFIGRTDTAREVAA
jgi:hypothetical protein